MAEFCCLSISSCCNSWYSPGLKPRPPYCDKYLYRHYTNHCTMGMSGSSCRVFITRTRGNVTRPLRRCNVMKQLFVFSQLCFILNKYWKAKGYLSSPSSSQPFEVNDLLQGLNFTKVLNSLVALAKATEGKWTDWSVSGVIHGRFPVFYSNPYLWSPTCNLWCRYQSGRCVLLGLCVSV